MTQSSHICDPSLDTKPGSTNPNNTRTITLDYKDDHIGYDFPSSTPNTLFLQGEESPFGHSHLAAVARQFLSTSKTIAAVDATTKL